MICLGTPCPRGLYRWALQNETTQVAIHPTPSPSSTAWKASRRKILILKTCSPALHQADRASTQGECCVPDAAIGKKPAVGHQHSRYHFIFNHAIWNSKKCGTTTDYMLNSVYIYILNYMHVDKSCCFSLSLSPCSSVKIAPGSGEKQDTIQVQKRAPLHTQIYIYAYHIIYIIYIYNIFIIYIYIYVCISYHI